MTYPFGPARKDFPKATKIDRDMLFWHFLHYQGEGAYPASAVRRGNWKLVKNYHFEDMNLFDISKDPYEENDVAGKHPELVAELDTHLQAWLEETGGRIPVPNS